MAQQQTQRPATQSPAPAPSAPASAPRGAQDSVGNAAVAAGLQSQGPGASVAESMPSQLELTRAGLHFALPAHAALTDDWNQVQTTERTGVWISCTSQALSVQFSPALEVDAQWPLSNVDIDGFSWDFTKGAVGAVHLRNTQLGIPIDGSVRSSVTQFVEGLLRGTPAGRAGYDPATDRDLAGTLGALKGRLDRGGGTARGASGVGAAQITGVGLSAEAKLRTELRAGAGDGGVRLPAGATIALSVALAGNGETLSRGGVPNVDHLDLSSSDLVLESGGKPIARLRSLTVRRGGVVDVTDFEPLGKLAEVGAGESLLRLFGALVAMRASDAGTAQAIAQGADLRPGVVNGLAERQMEESLTSAVQGLVREHWNVIPGVDLRQVLGVGAAAGGRS